MQLKSIELQNFRQFKNVHVDFAEGNDGRNVTIIIGQNGAGKTTIEQAFFWCLYGKTNFKDKILLNRDVMQKMLPEQEGKVRVDLSLFHNGIEYTLTRELPYIKTYAGIIKQGNSKFDIGYKDEYGKQKFIEENKKIATVQDIMPQALSQYFFFDGERIEEMGKEISEDKKVGDFENAVRGLLGLDAIMNALKHFKPGNKSTVIGYYSNNFNAGANEELREILDRLKKAEEQLATINDKLVQIDSDTKKAQEIRDRKRAEVATYDDGLRLQKQLDGLVDDINLAESTKQKAVAEAADFFNRDLSSFLSLSLIDRAVDFINSQDISDASLPYVRAATLDYLRKQGKCICGRDLVEGTPAYKHIMGLYDYVYPKSIATIAKDFKNESRVRVTGSNGMYRDVITKISTANQQEQIRNKKQDELTDIRKGIAGSDVKEKVKELNNQINICEDKIRGNNREHDKLIEERGSLTRQMKNDKDRRADINAANDQNKKNEICLAYANRIYDELNDEYTRQETEVRTRLQDTINTIFRDIYDGELHLEINTNYHISVRDTRYESGVETSSGQSIAVIFAFITALIQMAKENGQQNNQLLAHEVYPLVMDAPLSLFDKTRIDTVCRKLPTIAEQVVIFIKDTDGDLAKTKMAEFIGREYHFDKISEFDTRIESGERG